MDKKRIVIPGELLSDDPAMSGSGTYISGGKVYASVCGLLATKGKFSVHPLSGPYMPKRNDLIIGYVTVVTSSNWIFDINCPYEGLLHVTEYPLRVPSEEMTQHFAIGDTVLLKVTDVNAEMKIELTYKDPVCKKLAKGRLFEVPYSKVSRIIGRAGGMISMLKAKTGCDIFVGGNGRIWMNGNSLDLDILMNALKKIESDARLPGLTDLTAAFIDEQYEAAGLRAHDAAAPKTEVFEPAESVSKKAGIRRRKSESKAETQDIDSSAPLEEAEAPKKERKPKKAAEKENEKDKDSSSAPSVGQFIMIGNGAEKAAGAGDSGYMEMATIGSAITKQSAKKSRLTPPVTGETDETKETDNQNNCSCFTNVFFTHPPVHQGDKSDR